MSMMIGCSRCCMICASLQTLLWHWHITFLTWKKKLISLLTEYINHCSILTLHLICIQWWFQNHSLIVLSDKILSRQLTLTSRLTANNFKCILCYTWNLVILKYYLLSIWNSNLTGYPVFLSAKFDSPYPQHKISRSYCISFTFINIKLFSYLFYRFMEVITPLFLPLTFWENTWPQIDGQWKIFYEAFFWESNFTVSLQISLEIVQVLGWLLWVSREKRKYMKLLKGMMCLQTHLCGSIMSHGGQVHTFVCSVSWVIQSCPTLCNPMDCSMPGFPVHHQLPELSQTHAHRDSDAIQPSHPLSSPSPPTFNLSQHQGLF